MGLHSICSVSPTKYCEWEAAPHRNLVLQEFMSCEQKWAKFVTLLVDVICACSLSPYSLNLFSAALCTSPIYPSHHRMNLRVSLRVRAVEEPPAAVTSILPELTPVLLPRLILHGAGVAPTTATTAWNICCHQITHFFFHFPILFQHEKPAAKPSEGIQRWEQPVICGFARKSIF